ncbi:MAG: Carboxylase [Cyanobacteria bacterium RYN_339]|nr:Carboxylase [Cyanobacteria bacterium RYN_339]
MSTHELAAHTERVLQGGGAKYREKLEAQGKLFVRDRLKLLFDREPQLEDGLFAEVLNPELPADGVVTGIGEIEGRPVAFMAADSTVKAGSWGAKSVEKLLRIQETAMKLKIPMLYLVDSAGARITDQIAVFPGRRHGGRVFYHQVKMSGVVPQVTLLFGPSPAGAAYVPAFSDVVIMVDGNASAYLGSPRMAEMAIGEKVTLEQMGGARMHCTTSGLGDFLAKDEREAIALARTYLGYMPSHWQVAPPSRLPAPPASFTPLDQIIPAEANKPFDMRELIDTLVDADSFFELKQLFAPELITGFGSLDGRVVGIVANQPKVKGGTLFIDSSDKGARFCTLCNAFGIPLLFLSDVPGFMIGSAVEKAGIIRHGAKFVAAVAQATVPKICVVVRKCYGAGLYAMAGPALGTDATLALPSAEIAVMGPEAAVNAVYANVIEQLPEDERAAFVAAKREEYAEDIDIFRLAGELIVDAVIPFDGLRRELSTRFRLYASKDEQFSVRRNPVYPV